MKADELGPPEVYTITLGVSYSEQDWPDAGRAFEVEAEINFGAGGATQVVKIDWLQGAQISLEACTSCHATWKQQVVDEATWETLT